MHWNTWSFEYLARCLVTRNCVQEIEEIMSDIHVLKMIGKRV
jgi:hypothetical protein